MLSFTEGLIVAWQGFGRCPAKALEQSLVWESSADLTWAAVHLKAML